jgi:hypothetical protein
VAKSSKAMAVRPLTVALAFAMTAALIPLAPLPARAETFVVVNTEDSGLGSLRQTILDANANPGPDTITFDIDGEAPHVISLGEALPPITDPVEILGPDQESETTVVIDGGELVSTAVGIRLDLGSSGSVIKNLEIRNFGTGILVPGSSSQAHAITGNRIHGNSNSGIFLTGAESVVEANVVYGNGTGINLGTSANGNILDSNLVGTADGLTASPNNVGVNITNGSANLVVANVISGNTTRGLRIGGVAGTNNVVRGNLIGTTADGAQPLANGTDGVIIQQDAGNNTIGGTDPTAGNLISGNLGPGVLISGAGNGNQVLGNTIGLDVEGTALGNGGHGIWIPSTSFTTVANNTIRSNGGHGIFLNGSFFATLRANSIDDNTLLGIRLESGANGGITAPFVWAGEGPGEVVLEWFDGPPDSIATFEVFTSPTCDPTGSGEGRQPLELVEEETSSEGFVQVSTVLEETTGVVTATVTDVNGNTSEFSNCLVFVDEVNGPPVAVDDFVNAARATPALIRVLENDFDPDEDELFISALIGVQPEDAGSAPCEFEGTTCTFTGAAGFTGMAGFGYTVSDGIDTDDGSVTVDVAQTFGGDGTATIDGVVDAEEWAGAASFDVLVSDGTTDGRGRVYFMNDEENLYLALVVDGIGTADPLVEIRFDENGDGSFDNGEDALRWTGGECIDGFYDFGGDDVLFGFIPDTLAEQANDCPAASSTDGAGVFSIELSHPLSSGDTVDVDLTSGDFVAFQIETRFSAFFGDSPPTATTVMPGDGGTLTWEIGGEAGTVTVTGIGANAESVAAGFAVPLRDIPAQRLVAGANSIASAPLGAIELQDSPLGAIPLGAIPLGAIGGDTALGQTLLSEIPIPGGWGVLLEGTPYEGRPLQTLTLDEVSGVIDPVVLATLGLGDIRLGSTGLSNLSLAALTLGDVPLSAMCTGCPNESVLAIETSGRIVSAPLGAIPLGAIPLGAIGDLESAPLGAIPLGAIPLGAIPLGAIGDILASPLGAIPLGAIGDLAARPHRVGPAGGHPSRGDSAGRHSAGSHPTRCDPSRGDSAGCDRRRLQRTGGLLVLGHRRLLHRRRVSGRHRLVEHRDVTAGSDSAGSDSTGSDSPGRHTARGHPAGSDSPGRYRRHSRTTRGDNTGATRHHNGGVR